MTKALRTAALALLLLAGVSGAVQAQQRVNAGSIMLTEGPCLLWSDALGSPEGRLVGNPCHIFIRGDGGPGTIVYVKESGVGTNTGWVQRPTIPVPATQGGTGQTVYTVGDLFYADTTTTLAKLASVAAGSYLRSDGVGTAPVWSTLVLPNAATTNRIVYATSANTWGESGNLTFNGTTLGVGGLLSVSGFGTHLFSAAGTGVNALKVINTTAGTSNYADVGIEADSAGGTLHLRANSSMFTPSGIHLASSGVVSYNMSGGLSIAATHASGAISFYTGGTTLRAQINTNGTQTWAPYGAGTATFDASGNITSVSDERMKDIIGPFTPGLNAVLGVRPILHRYTTASGLDAENVYASFSAQNVMGYIPEAVGKNLDGMYSINIVPIVAATVTAVQELSREVDELRAAVGLSAKARTVTALVGDTRVVSSPKATVLPMMRRWRALSEAKRTALETEVGITATSLDGLPAEDILKQIESLESAKCSALGKATQSTLRCPAAATSTGVR
jgi:hypothetical protein